MLGDILVVSILAGIVVLSIRSLYKARKTGGCCGNCSQCAGCREKR